MTSALDSGGHLALVLQRVARNAAGQNFTLLIDELRQEVDILVIDILDPELPEAAILGALLSDLGIAEELDIIS